MILTNPCSRLGLRQRLSSVSLHRITRGRCHGQSSRGDGPIKTDESAWQQTHYKYFLPIQTRWSDNDQYGHVNNVTYYSYFDTIINHYLVRHCGLNTDLKTSSMVGYMVDTSCVYRSPISFPEIALAGLAVSHIGRSSVRYTIAVFPELPAGQQARDQNGDLTESATDEALASVSRGHFRNHSLNACAVGQCVHVFVDAETNRPAPLPNNMKAALEKLHVQKTSNL